MFVMLACVWLWTSLASAQVEPGEKDYRFKAGDVVYLSVPTRPALNGELVIGESGAVQLPLIGAVGVAGLTLEEMQAKVWQALRNLYPSLEKTDVSLEPVLGYVVYVTGAVSEPGRYRFPGSPGLWDAIRKAGGPTSTAALDMVRIVDAESDSSQSRVFDVLKALETGSVDRLPKLGKQSTVVVPSESEAYVGALGVNIFGAVTKPGFYRLQGDHHDLMSAILLAGGATARASLGSVIILRTKDDGSVSKTEVNLKKYLDTGDTGSNPLLRAGDTVSVPERSSVGYQLSTNPLGLLISAIGTAASIALLIHYWND
jgi:protein involved in polysaccharide export with SLBB domain